MPTWISSLLLSTLALSLLAGAPGDLNPVIVPAEASVSIWDAASLRSLDPADAPTPDTDLLAVYLRSDAQSLELRFDFLDLVTAPGASLWVAIGSPEASTQPSGVLFDRESPLYFQRLLCIQANGEAMLYDSSLNAIPGFSAQVTIDPGLDTVVVQVDPAMVPIDDPQTTFQVFVASSEQEEAPLDRVPAFTRSSPPPASAANLVLAFRDALPAPTPALALRRWDGAHTGPYGQRHGLRHLLEAAAGNEVPIVLLDLKTPTSLSALDYLGQAGEVQAMRDQGLLGLAEPAYGYPPLAAAALDDDRDAGLSFGFPSSTSAYLPAPAAIPARYRLVFAPITDKSHVLRWQRTRYVPVQTPLLSNLSGTGAAAEPLDRGGLTLAARRALINAATNADPWDLLVLGGSLPESAWADKSVANNAFQYLRHHPWIHVLSLDELASFPAQLQSPVWDVSCQATLCLPAGEAAALASSARNTQFSTWDQDLATTALRLSALSDNSLARLARQTFFQLSQPASSPELAALRQNYIHRVDLLAGAALWAEHPGEVQACDGTGPTELCVLASTSQYTVYSPYGARLLAAFSMTSSGPIQWLAPRSQYSVGLGDSSDWDLSQAELADPEEIPGAFAGSGQTFQPYRYEFSPGTLSFAGSSNHIVKTYRLLPDGLSVSIDTPTEFETRLPLTGWPSFLSNASVPSTSPWSLDHPLPLQVEISGGSLTWESYRDSFSLMGNGEDPDFGYPPGHFLPFPLTLGTIRAGGHLQIDFHLPGS
jgi:hypothetical protein